MLVCPKRLALNLGFALSLSAIGLSCATGPSERTGTEHGLPNPTAVSAPIAPKTAPGGTPGRVSPSETRDYQDAYTLYSKAAYEAAIQKLQLFERMYPRSGLMSQV